MMAQPRPDAFTTSHDSTAGSESASGGKPPAPTASCQFLGELRDWLIVAWVLWWSWAYVQGALAQRFPHYLGWTRTLW
jgi:hypothetical protein